jgi:hypothetical protein
MQLPASCQSCLRPTGAAPLSYKKGSERVRREALLQCDVCDRFACADCLEVYDILSGYDFLCHECAKQLLPKPGERGH